MILVFSGSLLFRPLGLMSVLAAIWTPRLQPLAPVTKTKGWRNQIEREIHTAGVRSRSPRRKGGVKQHLKEWAQGHLSTACLWRLCYSLVGVDKTDARYGVCRLSDMATEIGGSERNCMYKLRNILADTCLVKLVQEVPHDKKPTNQPTRLPTTSAHPCWPGSYTNTTAGSSG